MMYAHWGTFIQPFGLDVAGAMISAKIALNTHQYRVVDHPEYAIGSRPDVIVQVTCIAQAAGTFVIVSAFSSDSKTAELARNTIREAMHVPFSP